MTAQDTQAQNDAIFRQRQAADEAAWAKKKEDDERFLEAKITAERAAQTRPAQEAENRQIFNEVIQGVDLVARLSGISPVGTMAGPQGTGVIATLGRDLGFTLGGPGDRQPAPGIAPPAMTPAPKA